MTPRVDVEAEIRTLLGKVPSVFERVPDELLPAEWDLAKRLQFGETLIPSRYRNLVGVAVAAAIRCPYAVLFHQELARLHGATEAEVAEAVHVAGLTAGLGVQLTGLEIDFATFAAEVREIMTYLAETSEEEGP